MAIQRLNTSLPYLHPAILIFRALTISILFGLVLNSMAAAQDEKLSRQVRSDSDTLEILKMATTAYLEGNYVDAALQYERAIALGADNGHAFYNLANSRYRLGKFGKAIADYRRALLQLPRDPDVQANLALARGKAVDRIESAEANESPLSLSSLLILNRYLNHYELTLLFLGVYVLTWSSVAWLLISKSSRAKNTVVVLSVITLWCLASTFLTRNGRLGEPRWAIISSERGIGNGVIISSEAKVYSGNGETFQVIFVLHQGAELELGQHRQEWIEVLLPENRRGWVKQEVIEQIT